MIKRFHFWAKVSLIAVYFIILAGAVVRMTGSGMGCPDWPKCFGYWIPPTDEKELQWYSGKNFKKGQIIIRNKELLVAKEDFTTQDFFDKTHWEVYDKHDYAIFNKWHTWTEYINRMLSVIAALPIVWLTLLAFQLRRQNQRLIYGCLLVIIAMGFQAWLGKTVVDSVLLPIKITTHMFMALLILATLVWLVFESRGNRIWIPGYSKLKRWSIVLFLVTLIQIAFGTQVRQFIDIQAHYLAPNEWLNDPPLFYYIHRSVTIVIILVTGFLFLKARKQSTPLYEIKWIMATLVMEIVLGISMAYMSFPFGSQALHLLLASVIFGFEFYFLLRTNFTAKPTLSK